MLNQVRTHYRVNKISQKRKSWQQGRPKHNQVVFRYQRNYNHYKTEHLKAEISKSMLREKTKTNMLQGSNVSYAVTEVVILN